MKKYLIALTLVGFAATSCYEKLNIAPPDNITTEQVMNLLKTADEATVQNILSAIADGLLPTFRGGGYDVWNNSYTSNYQGQQSLRSMTGNDLVLGRNAPVGDEANFYNGTNLKAAASNACEPFWNRGYAMSNAANKVYNLINEEMVAANPTSKNLKDYLARVFITRAYGYLLLMEGYSNATLGVPIYTKYDLKQPLQARFSTTECYDSILRWLNAAVTLLEAAGPANGGNYTPNGDGSLNLGVANFILARAALLAGNWTLAATAADKLIANYPTLMTEDQYVARPEWVTVDSKQGLVVKAENIGFLNLTKNPERILAWIDAKKSYGTRQTWMNSVGGSQVRIDDRLYKKADPADYRLKNFDPDGEGKKFYAQNQAGFTGGSEVLLSSYVSYKFACSVGLGGTVGASDATQSGQNDYCEFRVSEAILMKAEALAQQGQDPSPALDLLISARTNGAKTSATYAWPADVTTGLQKVQFQTRLEMWGERGLEWYNNRRWNIPVNRSGSLTHHNPAMTYSVADMTLQIPMQEVNTNNKIVQNPL